MPFFKKQTCFKKIAKINLLTKSDKETLDDMTIHETPSMPLSHLSTHLSHYQAAALHESSPDVGVGTSFSHLEASRKVVHEPQKSEKSLYGGSYFPSRHTST